MSNYPLYPQIRYIPIHQPCSIGVEVYKKPTIKEKIKNCFKRFKKEQNMKRFDINNYTSYRYLMHCKTEEEAKTFCNYLHSAGKKWCTGDLYINKTRWGEYKHNTYYRFNNGSYGDLVKHSDPVDVILEFSDFDWSDSFTKSDLKDGMVIEHRDGDRYIVLGDFALSEEGNWRLKDYFEDLKWDGNSYMDIVKIYKVNTSQYMDFTDVFNDNYLRLIWERKEEKKEPKYKVGDRVKIKDDLSGNFEISTVFPEMQVMAGKTVTVTEVRVNGYDEHYRFKETRFIFSEDTIEGLVDYEEMTVAEIEKKLGYKVKIVDGE